MFDIFSVSGFRPRPSIFNNLTRNFYQSETRDLRETLKFIRVTGSEPELEPPKLKKAVPEKFWKFSITGSNPIPLPENFLYPRQPY
uniref:Uncharacterized protein n=1 Tax=Meloidogyne enterolobii TaxID=390850 RepID=A0A6V7VLU3_MELEN|nr:unnamed protein product [Meloidogyne enterolobii]